MFHCSQIYTLGVWPPYSCTRNKTSSQQMPWNSRASVEFYITHFSAHVTGRLSDIGNKNKSKFIFIFFFWAIDLSFSLLNLKISPFCSNMEHQHAGSLSVYFSCKAFCDILGGSSVSGFQRSVWNLDFLSHSILACLSGVWDFPVFWDYV